MNEDEVFKRLDAFDELIIKLSSGAIALMLGFSAFMANSDLKVYFIVPGLIFLSLLAWAIASIIAIKRIESFGNTVMLRRRYNSWKLFVAGGVGTIFFLWINVLSNLKTDKADESTRLLIETIQNHNLLVSLLVYVVYALVIVWIFKSGKHRSETKKKRKK